MRVRGRKQVFISCCCELDRAWLLRAFGRTKVNVALHDRAAVPGPASLSQSTTPRASGAPLEVRVSDLDGQFDSDNAGSRGAVHEDVLKGVNYCRIELRAGAAF